MAFAVGRQMLRVCATASAMGLQCTTAFAQADMPTNGTLTANPYGALSVVGGSLIGSTITGLQPGAVIQLGSIAGAAGSYAEIDFQNVAIASGNTLTIRAGAPGQTLRLVNSGATAASIQGSLQADAGNTLAPIVYLHSAAGISVGTGASISAASGLTLDALDDSSWTVGQPIVNQGTIDGGSSLRLLAAKVNGGGNFKGNAIEVGTFGNANNPVNGAHFLANGLQLAPSAGSDVALTINDFGTSAQFLNLAINGNARVAMPSAWPAGSSKPPNNAGVPFGGMRPTGVPEPSYGGGSIIVQASGSLTLDGGTSGDLVFPGGVVLRAGGTLDVGSVLLNQGWTTTGRPFQGVFLESPNIVASGTIRVLSNNLNFVNFSTAPHASVATWTLQQMPDGSAAYVAADTTAPHLNMYSTLVEAAANGQCWTCLVNPTVVSFQSSASGPSVAVNSIPSPTAGDFVQLQALVTDALGNPVASPIAWTSSDATKAIVTPKGLLMALQPGAVGITAEVGAKAYTLSLNVQDRDVPAGTVLVMLGPEEVVFDYATDSCEQSDLPDMPAHAVRMADQSILLLDTNDPHSRIMIGADFDSLKQVCTPIYTSTDDPTASSFKNREWIWAPYRVGDVIHALVHNEYHDPADPGCLPGHTGTENPCWYNSVTYAVSTDNGRTFIAPPSPAHLVAPPIRRWNAADPGARTIAQGYFSPSNIVARSDGYFYALFRSVPYTAPFEGHMTCVMRTKTLADPSSWRAWDGQGYNLAMPNPYNSATPAQACKAVLPEGSIGGLTYNTYLQQYVQVSDENFLADGTQCGISYFLSPDLVTWTLGVLFKPAYLSSEPPCRKPGGGRAGEVQYPSIIDHRSASINFEDSGQAPYLYFTQFTSDTDSLYRNLVRQPIIFLKSTSQGSDYTHPSATLEIPQAGATLSGSVTVSGFAFDNDSISRVEVLLDANVIGTATYGIPRPDVAAHGFTGAPVNCGFQFVLDSTKYPDGAHILAIRAIDPTGNATTMEATVTLAN